MTTIETAAEIEDTTEFGPIGRSVYERTYSRPLPNGRHEHWPDTVRRVVRGNTTIDGAGYCLDAGRLSSLMTDFRLIPAGRHLWVTGVDGVPGEARRNCWRAPFTSRLADHFEFTGSMLLLGGGVGANYSQEYLAQADPITPFQVRITIDPTHADASDVMKAAGRSFVGHWPAERTIVVDDSREGWVDAWGTVFDAATDHGSIVFDLSKVRPAGSPILTFGGTASGPGPLASSIANIIEVLAPAAGRTLTGIEAMHCDHALAAAVVAGGARRSARMSIMHWSDPYIFEFIKCKTDHMHHWTTNISVEVDEAFFASLDQDSGPLANHAQAVMNAVIDGMIVNGEPGFYNVSLAQVGERADVRATNPCLRGDQRILTTDGWRKIESLVGSTPTIAQDARIIGSESNGTELWSLTNDKGTVWNESPAVFLTRKNADLVTVTLKSGHEFVVTPDHGISTTVGLVDAVDLTSDHRVLITTGDQFTADPSSDEWNLGFVVGNHHGDGFMSEGSAKWKLWGDECSSAAEFLDKLKAAHEYLNLPLRSDATGHHGAQDDVPFVIFSSRSFGAWMADNDLSKYDADWSGVHEQSKNFKSGFLAGLHFTDGHVEGTPDSSVSARWSMSESEPLRSRTVQLLLSELGVHSSLYSHARKRSTIRGTTYDVLPTHRVCVVGKSNLTPLISAVPLVGPKASKLSEALATYSDKGTYATKAHSAVRSVVPTESADVFCLTEDVRRTLVVQGVSARRCGEVPLEEGESCNIGSVNLDAIGDDQATAEEAFRYMTRFLMRQTLSTMKAGISHDVETENRRIGVGFLGLQGWAAAHGVKFSDIHRSPELLAKLRRFRSVCRAESIVYADELGIPVPIKVTAVAPNGSIAQLPGTQPGAHPILMRYGIRNVRYTTGDRHISDALDAGLVVEGCIYAENTWVVSYPMVDPLMARFDPALIEDVSQISVHDQLQVLAAVTEAFCGGTDGNGVSFTASFDPEAITWSELHDAVREALPRCKGITAFPTTSRPQAPYIPITESAYLRLTDRGAFDDGDTGDNDISACVGGACPIK